MGVSSVTILSPVDGHDFPDPGIVRPRADVRWVNDGAGGGPYDVLYEWDKVTTFDSVDLIQVTNTGIAGTEDFASPTADLGPAGQTWHLRITVTDTADSGSLASVIHDLIFFDPKAKPRWLELLANVGPNYDPAEGATDIDPKFMERSLYLLANVGPGNQDGGPDDEFRFTRYLELLANVGGGYQDGGPDDAFRYERWLYLLEGVTTDLPTPFLIRLDPNFGRPGDAFKIAGDAMRPYDPLSEGLAYTQNTGTNNGTLTDGFLPPQTPPTGFAGSTLAEEVVFQEISTTQLIVTVDLLTSQLANELRVWLDTNNPPDSVTVEGSADNTTWDPLGSLTQETELPNFWTLADWAGGWTYRYWRFTIDRAAGAIRIGEVQVNRRMRGGDVEARLDDTVTDWNLALTQWTDDEIVTQAPASDEPGGDVRVQNIYAEPDLVSNDEHYTFLPPAPRVGLGLIVKIYDRDSPQNLIAVVPDAIEPNFSDMLSDVGSWEFSIPKASELLTLHPNLLRKWNRVSMEIDGVERFTGWVAFVEEKVVDQGEESVEAFRVVGPGILRYLGRATLYPKNWPSLDDPVWDWTAKNEIQSLTIIATTGTYTLTFNGQTTGLLNWNDGPEFVKQALETLTNIAEVDVRGTGDLCDPFHIEFLDPGASDQPLLTADDANLTGGTIEVSTTQPGSAARNEIQEIIVKATGGTYRLRFTDDVNGDQDTGDIAWDASAATIEAELEALPGITNVVVVGTGSCDDPYVIEFADPGLTDVAELTFAEDANGDPINNLTGGTATVAVVQEGSPGGITPGDVMLQVITDAQDRGTIPSLSPQFTTLKDSNNEDWADKLQLSFPPGVNYLRILSQLIALGTVARMDSQFRFYLYRNYGFDQTADPGGPRLVLGHTISQLSLAEQFENPVNVALIGGEDLFIQYQDPTSITEWGRWEGFAQTSADNATTAQRIAEAAVAEHAQPLDQISCEIHADANLTPYVDFRPGDWVLVHAPTKGITNRKYRVRGIHADSPRSGERPRYVVELNSVRLEKIIQHELQLAFQSLNTLDVGAAGSTAPGGAATKDHGHPLTGDVSGRTDETRVNLGGDLSGRSSSGRVVGLQGRGVKDAQPATGDTWEYRGGLWVPSKHVAGIPVETANKAAGRVLVYRTGPERLRFEDQGGGGGGGSSEALGRASSASSPGGASDDEFDDETRDPAWVEVQRSGDTNAFLEKYGRQLYRHLDQAGGSRDLHALLRPVTLAVGDYIEAAVEFRRRNNFLGPALIMADGTTFGSGNQVVAWAHRGTNTHDIRINGWTSFNTAGIDGFRQTLEHAADMFYMRLKYEAADTWGLYISIDGVTWLTVQTNYAKTLTPTHIGICAVHWGPPAPIASWLAHHYLRLNPPDD